MTIDYLLRNYSGPELLDMARKGLLCIDSYDISKIVCAATEQLYTQDQYYQYGDDEYKRGYDAGYWDAE